MRVTRRRFLQIVAASTAALGLTSLEVYRLTQILANEASTLKFVWLQGQSCTGCTISFANLEWDGLPEGLAAEVSTWLGTTQTLAGVTEPDGKTTIDDVLLDIIDLKYLQTIMATSGARAHNILTGLYSWNSLFPDPNRRILIVEGSIPTTSNKYCTIGNNPAGTGELFIGNAVSSIAATASVVIAAGTCASFGGVPAANTNPARAKTGAKGVSDFLKGLAPPITTPVVNVPGCPVHPDWLFGTLVHYILGDLLSNLDAYGRPKFYFGSPIHGGRCLRYQGYCDGQFVSVPGGNDVYFSARTMRNERKCLAMLGCKGFSTYADCVFGGPGTAKGRGWNVYSRDAYGNPISGTSCINSGYPCIGCSEKAFPDRFSPFLRD